MENRENEIFLYPYYSYVQQKISSVVPNDTIMGKSNHINSLTYQIVSYAYENYFKFVYPYEYRLAKNNNYLSGDTDKEQNRDFVVNLSSEEEWIEYLFEKYPKLLYMLETYTNGIILYLKKFLSSLQKDYQLLNSFFKLENSGVDEIQLFKGDLHNEECVSSVSFSNGVKLYYKPRCAANEKFLSDVIDLLRGMGWDVKLGIPKYIDGCSYSWHLHISPKEMTNRDSIKDYYENLGKLQGLFYLLGSQDVIPDNVFCIAGCTYLIDCESILTKPYRYKDSSKLSMYLQESVIRTGILPDWMFSNANERNKISSVLFKFDDKNCHLPKVNGASVEIASDTLQYFENGFEEACNFFIAHNVEIFNFLNSYNPLRITERVLLHPTVIYTLILREMVTPPYLHGTENIKKLIEPIVREESFGSERSRIIESISDQIESGNVPFFYTMSVDPSLYTLPHKTVIKNWISKNCEAFYSIKKRLQSLNRKRENEQISIIDESVNFFLDVKDRRQKEKRILPTDGNVLDGQSIMEAIERIDKEIQNRMIDVDEELGFVCRTKNGSVPIVRG
ncbi:DUF4135 domain-containing protein [Hallella multisaccharivorax]|uniref:DUF4135 domain-containing protein n=1 Tax=Hallella multisaccharivorax TaxID=310514 RepID=UPI00145D2E25|nr:DUF4135 domain-containing protein [Hallella multisaccharivorax]